MSIKVFVSGETQSFWRNDAYSIRSRTAVSINNNDEDAVVISYKRPSKGGGVLDHRIEIATESYASLLAVMKQVDREALIRAYRAAMIVPVQDTEERTR
jgi:hypothetical protein